MNKLFNDVARRTLAFPENDEGGILQLTDVGVGFEINMYCELT